MDEKTNASLGEQQQPTGHPLPRRASPANSVTLRHHRIARDSSRRAHAGSVPPQPPTTAETPSNPKNNNGNTSSPCRNSSGESHDTGQSDPKTWFDQSNKNPTATFDSHAMDVDPPFFQKESDSSNEGKSYQQHMMAPAKLTTAQSSSADEYRSVIDDLTIEIQKLKDELKRYKQKGPDMLRKDQLFEIKFHGLPGRKKRELESTLRDFAANLGDSPDTHSSRRKKVSPRNGVYDPISSGGSGSRSKHASSSSGSYNRPVDSAYASMSTGNNSSGVSLGRPSMSSRAKSSEQKVESYLRDIPEGLYPRNVLMTDKEKKKIVVRRLEQLFTGKIGGRQRKRIQQQQQQQQQQSSQQPSTSGAGPSGSSNFAPPPPPAPASSHLAAVMGENQQNQQRPLVHQPPTLGGPNGAPEASREARILPAEQASSRVKKSSSRDNGSASNSGGDQTESGGNGNNTSPPNPPPPEQRPTRPNDLDPDRVQVPSENMEYIKHLGLVPPELINQPQTDDVHPDADGWVYLNLLCNLAQLHMINVTPDFVRVAVSDFSAKFQLSPDGRKIRWRGGTEGTKFSSDSSGDNGRNSDDMDDTDSSNKDGSSKRQKTTHSTGDEFQSGTGSSSKNASNKFAPQVSASSESFHYKPLFARQGSSREQTSMDETLSSFGPVEDSNVGDSRWGQSGSGATSNRRKRRRDGAVIYYSGAPFCTDLSGDPGDTSPMTYMMSSGQGQQEGDTSTGADAEGGAGTSPARPRLANSDSGSSLDYRPLVDKAPYPDPVETMEIDSEGVPGLMTDSGGESEEIDIDLPWSGEQQYLSVLSLEPCGLGGVMPEDHFMVVVTTRRRKEDPSIGLGPKARDENITDSIISRLESMTTSSPVPQPASIVSGSASGASSIAGSTTGHGDIEYVSGRIKRLAPVRLPPPAVFFPPFSESSMDDSDMFGSEGDDEFEESSEITSRRANIPQSDGYPDGVDLSSGDEDGEDPDDEPETNGMYDDEDEAGGAGGATGRGNSAADKRMRLLQGHRMRRTNSNDSGRPRLVPERRRQSSAEAAAGTTARDRSKSISVAGGTNRSSAATVGEPIGGGSSGYISS